MKRMAMIQNGVVANIALWDGNSDWAPAGYTLVDITNLGQFIDLGYLYDGTNFTAPTVTITLAQQAAQYIAFGNQLFDQISQEVWAANEAAAVAGNPLTIQQLTTLLSESNTLQLALQSGSLTTSAYLISQMVAAFPQYASIGTNAINQINSFTAANPLA